jgi:hypothetical protein
MLEALTSESTKQEADCLSLYPLYVLWASCLSSPHEGGLQRPQQLSGGNVGGVTPVPIPNTEVKPSRADGTPRETAWESRSLPDFFRQSPLAGVLSGLPPRGLSFCPSTAPSHSLRPGGGGASPLTALGFRE